MTAKTMEHPLQLPLVATLNSRGQEFDRDARLINAYAEKDEDTGQYDIEKRPGFSVAPAFATTAGTGQGIFCYPYVSLGIRYVTIFVNGGQAYSYQSFSGGTTGPGALGPVASTLTNGKFQFLGIPSGITSSVIFSAAKAQGLPGNNTAYVSTGTGPMVTLTGGDASGFPLGTVAGFVYLNGFIYVMDSAGVIWQSTAQNVVTGAGSWTNGGTSFITAGSDVDYGIQLARQLVYVVAIKTWSTQFFYDAGNLTGSSLSPVPGALFEFGCADSDTFADLDGVLFWVSQSKSGVNQVVMVEELQLSVVSNEAVERQLDLALAMGPFSTTTSWIAYAFHRAGHKFYVLTHIPSNTTMVYDVEEDLWYLWTDYQGNFFPVSARTQGPGAVEWQQILSTGAVYISDGDYVYPNDSGNIAPVDIYTPKFDGGIDRKKMLSMMRFHADQTTGSLLNVRVSDDDYNTWSNFRPVDLGVIRPILDDCGTFYQRAWHMRHASNTPFRITSVDLQMDVGTL